MATQKDEKGQVKTFLYIEICTLYMNLYIQMYKTYQNQLFFQSLVMQKSN